MVRAQYHFRQTDSGLLAWDVRRLIDLSKDLPAFLLPISASAEIDENYWYAHAGQIPTCRSLIEHMRLIDEADLRFPIILDARGRVMDGMHRVCKAIRNGESHIRAVQFVREPEPDFVGVEPMDLPYDDRFHAPRQATPMIELDVQDFDVAHQQQAAELINDGLGKRFGFRDDTKNPDLYDIGVFYSEDCFLVALYGGDVIGTGALIYESRLAVRLARMHTAEKFRRKGVGTAIITELESRARRYGAREVFPETPTSTGTMRTPSISPQATRS